MKFSCQPIGLFVVIVEKQAEYDAANAGKSDGEQQQELQELHDDKDNDEDDDDDDDDDDDKSQSLERSSLFASRDSGIKSVMFTIFHSRIFKRCAATVMGSN